MGTTYLRYNDDFIPYGITATIKLIKASFTRLQVAIIAPYTAQVASYRHAMFRFIEWCLKQPNTSEWFGISHHLYKVEIFTVDKMQGGEQECIVYYTTNLGDLGFIVEATR